MLSETEAWEIAMAWQDDLQGSVQLLTDRDGPVDSIIARYAWIYIDKNTALTYAVMRMWTALASCPGFHGDENPSFWKRIVSHLQTKHAPQHYTRVNRDTDPLPVTNTIEFFTGPDHNFPRFMISTMYPQDEAYDTEFEQLFTPAGPSLSPVVHTKLQTLLARFLPYQRDRVDPVNVCLRLLKGANDIHELKLASLVRAVYEGPHCCIRQIKTTYPAIAGDRKPDGSLRLHVRHQCVSPTSNSYRVETQQMRPGRHELSGFKHCYALMAMVFNSTSHRFRSLGFVWKKRRYKH